MHNYKINIFSTFIQQSQNITLLLYVDVSEK